MEKYIHSPFFKTLVMNCFVRIGIGQHHGQAVYRAAEIVDVVETAKVYHVGNSKTNLGLRLKFGKEERVFRVEFISNQHISPGEFEKWKAACQKADLPLPTIEFVKSKALAIKKANNYNFTSDDIGKKHALKKYDQFVRNTSCFCTMYNFSQFWSHLCGTMHLHCLPQMLKSRFFEIFQTEWL